MFWGGLHDGDPLKSMIMLELQQFLENHILEKSEKSVFDHKLNFLWTNKISTRSKICFLIMVVQN